MRLVRLVVLILVILGLGVSMLDVTCLQHWYQGRFDAYHSIFEFKGGHQHSEPLGEDDCRLTSASHDDMLLTPVKCDPGVMPTQTLLSADQPFESFTPASPLAALKVYHSPPFKPPTL